MPNSSNTANSSICIKLSEYFSEPHHKKDFLLCFNYFIAAMGSTFFGHFATARIDDTETRGVAAFFGGLFIGLTLRHSLDTLGYCFSFFKWPEQLIKFEYPSAATCANTFISVSAATFAAVRSDWGWAPLVGIGILLIPSFLVYCCCQEQRNQNHEESASESSHDAGYSPL